MRGLARRRGQDEGASAVEFALVVLPLLLIVFGIINFGVIFGQQLALNNGVRQGVRMAVVAGNPTNQSCQQVVVGVQGATGPAIAMDTNQIGVRVQRVLSSNNSTVASCYGGAFQKAPVPASATRVCVDATNRDVSIKADAQYQTSFLAAMPFLGAPTLTLTATAVYRCEFNS